MEKPNHTLGRIFYYIWRGFNLNRIIVFGLLAFFFTIFFIVSLFSGGDNVKVPQGAALVFAPKGIITEQTKWVDPIAEAMQEAFDNQDPPEESVYDLIEVLRNAKDDNRITMVVIYPQSIMSVGPAMLEMLKDAIADFKQSGKKVYAMADYYGQPHYYLAAQADEVYMHPYGGVMIEGYSRVRTYYRAMLDKLMITPNVFKVGKYKSAVEPYLFDAMSEQAKEANMAYLSDLWTAYKNDVIAARKMDAEVFEAHVNQFDEHMKAAQGDWGKVAIENKLVDGLKSRPEFREMMIALVGENEKKTSFKQIHHKDYLKSIKPPFPIQTNKTKVAVIVAKGAILDGSQKEGQIGGDTLASKIRKARNNEKTAAIVLRVDSPGGSAFASEIIREELIKAKEQKLPIIVSMGTYAASGGYWISANADEIWARPTTITGSIGIFGMIPTFEKTLDWAGIHRDGVGTTKFAGSFDTGRELSQPIKDIIQVSIENGYRRFINLVAEGRNMTPEDVDAIAQGRVWSGVKAKELGLVDQLGTLNDAIKSAATKANLDDKKYEVWFVERELSKNELFLKQILNSSTAQSLMDFDMPKNNTSADHFVMTMKQELTKLQQYNDPHHMYVHCNCEIQ